MIGRDRCDAGGGEEREHRHGGHHCETAVAAASARRWGRSAGSLRLLLTFTGPLAQAHGAIMQLSNADSGLIVVPPFDVFKWSGPTSDAGASAV